MPNTRSSRTTLTDFQVLMFAEGALPKHKAAAAARGLDGWVMMDIGTLNTSDSTNSPPLRDGGPATDDHGHLQLSAWQPGKRITGGAGKPDWVVQNNRLVEFRNVHLFANLVTLVRPLDGSTLPDPPVPPPGFMFEPGDLAEAVVNPILVSSDVQRTVAQYILKLCIEWGDWSRLPHVELMNELSDLFDTGSITDALTQLEALGYVRSEQADAALFIQPLPAITALFSRPTT